MTYSTRIRPRTTEEAAEPRARSASATIGFACLAMLTSYLPFSAANGALGAIAHATGAATGELQWITDAFAVALGATVLSAGVFAERFGRRHVTLIGLLLTVAGSTIDVLAGVTHGLGAVYTLWIGQSLAGIGGGLVMSATLSLIAAASTTNAGRARAISLWAASVVVGLGAGPFLVAAISSGAPWNWAFAPVALLAVAVAVFGSALSAESSNPRGQRLDLPGQATGALGIAALAFGVIAGGSSGWGSPLALIPLAVAAVSLALFVTIERRSAAPLLNPLLFSSRQFIAAGIAAAAALFSIGGLIFVLSLFFSSQHVDGLGIALRLGSIFLGNFIASLAAAKIQLRLGGTPVLVSGLVIAAVGSAVLWGASSGGTFTELLCPLLIFGFGCGLVLATSSTVAIRAVPGNLAGMAGAANNALRQLGAALGPAVLGALVAGQLTSGGGYLGAVQLAAGVLAALFAIVAIITAALGHTQKTV